MERAESAHLQTRPVAHPTHPDGGGRSVHLARRQQGAGKKPFRRIPRRRRAWILAGDLAGRREVRGNPSTTRRPGDNKGCFAVDSAEVAVLHTSKCAAISGPGAARCGSGRHRGDGRGFRFVGATARNPRKVGPKRRVPGKGGRRPSQSLRGACCCGGFREGVWIRVRRFDSWAVKSQPHHRKERTATSCPFRSRGY
jgi:hypothetical protein